jgi:hypothetical protein
MSTNRPYNNMKKILFIFITVLTCGCNNNLTPAGPALKVTEDTASARTTISYTDPAIFAGSNILSAFYAELRAQNYDAAMNLIAPASIRKYGRLNIRHRIEQLEFNYYPKLLSVRQVGKLKSLRFVVQRYASRRFIKVESDVENDTCRIIVEGRLEDFLR